MFPSNKAQKISSNKFEISAINRLENNILESVIAHLITPRIHEENLSNSSLEFKSQKILSFNLVINLNPY